MSSQVRPVCFDLFISSEGTPVSLRSQEQSRASLGSERILYVHGALVARICTGAVWEQFLHGVCVGHALEGRRGFAQYRTPLPLRNRLAFDLDWPSCIPNAVESTEVVLFVPCVSPYFRTRYGSWEGVVNETQPGEAGAWPGRVVVRELLKWRAVRSLKQRLV